MRDRFDIGFTFILREEIGPFMATGGYVSAERARQIGDAGGETFAGIARATNPDWPGWAIVDRRKTEPNFPNNLNLDLPQNVELRRLLGERYRAKYWDLFRCGELPPGLDLCMLDAAVQHLPKVAVTLIQRAVGAQPDGALGPGTLAAANRANREYALHRYLVYRAVFYSDLITADSRLAKFRETWLGRLFNLQAYIIATSGGN